MPLYYNDAEIPPVSGPPSGPAGGVLSGTYPDPDLDVVEATAELGLGNAAFRSVGTGAGDVAVGTTTTTANTALTAANAAIPAATLTTNGNYLSRAAGVVVQVTPAQVRSSLSVGAATITTDPAPAVAATIYEADATAGAFSVTLPAASVAAGRFQSITVTKVDASANAVTLDGAGGELINGAATYALAAQWDSVTLYSNGTAWSAIAQVGASGNAMSFSVGHSWEREAPVTAGGGGEFLDSDSLQLYTSSGQASPGWGVELPSGLGPDRAGLQPSGGSIYRQGLDLSAYPIDACTLAVLFSWAGPIASFATLFVFGDSNSAPATSGASAYLKANGADFDLVVFGAAAGPGTFTTLTTIPAASLTVGLHAFCLAAVDVAGTHKWRWSFDGSAAVDTTMAANYVTPPTSGLLGVGTRHDGAYRLPGAVHDLCAWPSDLSGADVAALTTLPVTPSYRLPESASTTAAAIRVEAARYDASHPTVLPARGLPVPLTIDTSVRKVGYP